MTGSSRLGFWILILAVFLPGIGYSQESPPAGEGRRSVLPRAIQEKWLSYRQDFDRKDWTRALQDLESLESAAIGLGISNIEPLSAVILQDATDVLNAGDVDTALALSQHATELSADFPTAYFFRGRLILSNRPSDLMHGLTEIINGALESSRDIWTILYAIRVALFWMMVGGSVAYIAFILSVVLRYIPRMAHLFEELARRRLGRPAIYLLVSFLFVGPMWLGLGWVWGVIWWMMVFWVFMSFQERGITLSFVVVIATAGIWLPLWVSTERVKESPDFIVITRAARGEPGIELAGAGKPGPDLQEEDGLTALAKGLEFRRLNRLDRAAEQFNIALQRSPGDERSLVNLGNISFLEEHFDAAMSYYNRALALNPKSVEAHYNLAQASREKLLFDEGEKHYQDAKSLDPELTEKYTNQTAKDGGIRVVDTTIGLREVVSRALVFREEPVLRRADELFTMVWSASISSAPLIGLLFGAVFLLLSPRAYIRKLSFSCGICGRAICQSCQKHIFHLRVCRPCAEENKNVKRFSELRQIQQRRDRQMMMSRMMTILAPGSGHLFLMRSLRGALFIFIYTILVLTLIRIDVPFAMAYAWLIPSGWAGTGICLAALAVVYMLAFWDLARIEDLVGGEDIWH